MKNEKTNRPKAFLSSKLLDFKHIFFKQQMGQYPGIVHSSKLTFPNIQFQALASYEVI